MSLKKDLKNLKYILLKNNLTSYARQIDSMFKKTASSPNINNVSDADQLELYAKIMNFMSRKSDNDCGMKDKFLAVAGDASDIVDVKNFLETYIHEDNNGDGDSLGETQILTDCKSIMQSCEETWTGLDWKEGSEHDWWKKNVASVFVDDPTEYLNYF